MFLGCTNYYRSLIRNYAEIARPLIELTRKDKKFLWGEAEHDSFLTLKKKLAEYPVLRMPLLKEQFTVYTDCSNYCIGGVLSQIDPETKHEFVVENCSRMLKNSERFYGIAEKEMLSVLYCINKWRVYLCNEFIVVSDQKALTYLLSTKSPNMRLCRWFIELQAFNFKLKYRKGIEN